ncbi:hypothetical protein B296_00051873 [Ensete ventricosum]|uniref:Uncharacterized protein n=1 Tax=Ensete ventricosum TaxID=4639 RepID=A0A426X0V1_ENSVE|nr:hypothetical protein B296_00051873 [Ensete ventricosum]
MWARVKSWASGRSEDDAVRNSLGVYKELAEGTGSLSGWCKGVHRKKIETRRKIIGGNLKAYRELERKIARNIPGDRRRKTVRLATRNAGGYQSEGVRLLIKLVGHVWL